MNGQTTTAGAHRGGGRLIRDTTLIACAHSGLVLRPLNSEQRSDKSPCLPSVLVFCCLKVLQIGGRHETHRRTHSTDYYYSFVTCPHPCEERATDASHSFTFIFKVFIISYHLGKILENLFFMLMTCSSH